MPTTQTFERQKMSVEIWEKLKSHIMKQREKRKQEQEQDAEQERHRREQELKRRLDATTLEDIKEQLGKLETNLADLTKQKHELFLQLKKVLNEDEVKKKQNESEMLAARQVMFARSSQNQFNPYLVNTQGGVNNSMNSLLPNSNALSQQQQLNNAVSIQQQQQLLSRHSPITTVTSLPTQSNYMNSPVITQSLQPVHQQQSPQNQLKQHLTSKQRNLKRMLEDSSPKPSVPYNGLLPNYKTSNYKTPMNSYTSPYVSKIATTSHQTFFPQNRPPLRIDNLSIPISQSFDTKNPYSFLPGSAESAALAEHANMINSNQLNSQQLHQHMQQELYQQQFMKSMANLQSSSMEPLMMNRPPSNQPNTSAANSSSNIRFSTDRYMY